MFDEDEDLYAKQLGLFLSLSHSYKSLTEIIETIEDANNDS